MMYSNTKIFNHHYGSFFSFDVEVTTFIDHTYKYEYKNVDIYINIIMSRLQVLLATEYMRVKYVVILTLGMCFCNKELKEAR